MSTAQIRTTAASSSINETLREIWTQVTPNDTDTLDQLRIDDDIDFGRARHGVWDSDTGVMIPLTMEWIERGQMRRGTIVFALSPTRLVTLQPERPLSLFDKALARLRRQPDLAATPQSVTYALLYAINDAADRVINSASEDLEAMAEEIEQASAGVNAAGRDIGVADAQEVMANLSAVEQGISRSQESQLELARAARHLLTETTNRELREDITTLVGDIEGVLRHAEFEHDKIRYLQQALMTTLDIKQNQIVKVFTIITAVFLPPTLIASFYGMNFTHMPELDWANGYPVTIMLTVVAAVIPLWYIKRKGWLR